MMTAKTSEMPLVEVHVSQNIHVRCSWRVASLCFSNFQVFLNIFFNTNLPEKLIILYIVCVYIFYSLFLSFIYYLRIIPIIYLLSTSAYYMYIIY